MSPCEPGGAAAVSGAEVVAGGFPGRAAGSMISIPQIWSLKNGAQSFTGQQETRGQRSMPGGRGQPESQRCGLGGVPQPPDP